MSVTYILESCLLSLRLCAFVLNYYRLLLIQRLLQLPHVVHIVHIVHIVHLVHLTRKRDFLKSATQKKLVKNMTL